MTTKKTAKKPEINFEKSLQKLTQLVERMERGDLPLEDSLKYYEEGVGLIRQCQQALSAAEQKVQILTRAQGKDVLQPYQFENNDE